jgi:hypothetical protein
VLGKHVSLPQRLPSRSPSLHERKMGDDLRNLRLTTSILASSRTSTSLLPKLVKRKAAGRPMQRPKKTKTALKSSNHGGSRRRTWSHRKDQVALDPCGGFHRNCSLVHLSGEHLFGQRQGRDHGRIANLVPSALANSWRATLIRPSRAAAAT